MVSSLHLDSQIRDAVSLAKRVTGIAQPLETVHLSSWTTKDTAADEAVEDVEDLQANSVLMTDVIEEFSTDINAELAEPSQGKGEQSSPHLNDEIVVPLVTLKWEPIISFFKLVLWLLNAHMLACKFYLTSSPQCTILARLSH